MGSWTLLYVIVFKHLWFSPLPGEIIQFDQYSDALKPPTSTQLKKWRSDMAAGCLGASWNPRKRFCRLQPLSASSAHSGVVFETRAPLKIGDSPQEKIRKRHLFELNKYVIQLRCLQLMMEQRRNWHGWYLSGSIGKVCIRSKQNLVIL